MPKKKKARPAAKEMSQASTFAVLLIEPEYPEGLSARKLVMETARHNVLTAYNGKQGLEMFGRFPAVDVVVVHSELRDMACETVARQVKTINPNMPIVVLSPRGGGNCAVGDHVVSSHEPHALIELFAAGFGVSKTN